MSDLITTVGTGNNQSVTMFNFREHDVRVKMMGDEPMFCLADVCKALEIKNASDCKSRLNPKGVGIADTLTAGGIQPMTFINESNLYKVIFQSRTREAEAFTEWVTSEVLPAIRKHGAYMTPDTIEKMLSNPDLVIGLATELKEARAVSERQQLQIAEQRRQLEIQAPDVEYCQEVLSASNLHTVNSIAQQLKISAMKLNQFLLDENWIYKQGGIYYTTAKIRSKGYAGYHVIPYMSLSGETKTREHLKWTEQGRRAVIELWNKKHQIAG